MCVFEVGGGGLYRKKNRSLSAPGLKDILGISLCQLLNFTIYPSPGLDIICIG